MEKFNLSNILFVNLETNKSKSATMNNNQLILYSLKQVFEKYPTVSDRGWTENDFIIWLKQDIIAGNISESRDLIKIEKQSLEDFIQYHTIFLSKRITKLQEGMKNFKENKI